MNFHLPIWLDPSVMLIFLCSLKYNLDIILENYNSMLCPQNKEHLFHFLKGKSISFFLIFSDFYFV